MCINSDKLGTMYYMGGLRFPLTHQAAELGLSSTQVDGLAIITGIYKMKLQSNCKSYCESGLDLHSLFEPSSYSFSIY